MNKIKEITKELEKIVGRGYSHFNVFPDWIDLMLYALMRNDPKYLSIVNKYKNDKEAGKREIDFFTNAFGLLMLGMKNTNEEILGDIYQEWNAGHKISGQYFTPKHLAAMIAQMTIDKKLVKKKKGVNISDPACGAGIMLIEACKQIPLAKIKDCLFVGQDIDPVCAKMCALNLCLFNLNGYVIQGNTLLLEHNRVWQTGHSLLYGGSIRELSPEEVEKMKPMIRELLRQKIRYYIKTKHNKEEIHRRLKN